MSLFTKKSMKSGMHVSVFLWVVSIAITSGFEGGQAPTDELAPLDEVAEAPSVAEVPSDAPLDEVPAEAPSVAEAPSDAPLDEVPAEAPSVAEAPTNEVAPLDEAPAEAPSAETNIGKVVDLLQVMLDTSKEEGEAETKIYDKFKCSFDTSVAKKEPAIRVLTRQISLLESKIEETKGNSGELSSDCGDLKTKIDENKAARDKADTMREKEKEDIATETEELKKAVDQMGSALDTLKEGEHNDNFMTQKSLVALNSKVAHALDVATAFMNKKQRSVASSFLQAPHSPQALFDGSRSDAAIDVLTSMHDQFSRNLADSIGREEKAAKAHAEFITVKTEQYNLMKASYDEKQKTLAENLDTLAAKKSQLAQATKDKESEEESLAELKAEEEKKTKAYNTQKLLRVSEETAISQCIGILNSDAAYEAAGTATAGESFLQVSAIRRQLNANELGHRRAKKALQQAAQRTKSARLATVLALMEANPFGNVLGEMDKMVNVIDLEAKSDKDKLDWCTSSSKENTENLEEKETELNQEQEQIDKITVNINNPAQGLLAQLSEAEASLEENTQAQAGQTASRREENLQYQKNIKNLVADQSVLAKGISVLKAYYNDLKQKIEAGEVTLLQQGGGVYKGQSKSGDKAIEMLEYIESETKKAEMAAHAQEEQEQADYEDSMGSLKKEQAEKQKGLVDLQETLAQKQQDLLQINSEHGRTLKATETIKALIESTKQDCSFITTYFDEREENRKKEKASLESAKTAVKGTPAYKSMTEA